MRRQAILLFAGIAAALLLASGTALAALKIGTDGPDTLIGTSSADQITGRGGNDTLKGLAGNDVYYFDDGWGVDTLEEPLRVGRRSGGSDTLSFSQLDTNVQVYLIRQFGPSNNLAISGVDRVDLGASVVENATGGRGGDILSGGSDRNTLNPGGGGTDRLSDLGGIDGSRGFPELPASNDTFKGFESNTGTDQVTDWGGTADVVDLRPFASSEVYVTAIDFDGDGDQESLQIVTGASAQVIVVGHFGEYRDFTSCCGQQGLIEQLVFSDGTFSGQGTVGSSGIAGASSEESSTGTVEALISASKERAEKTSEGAELERAARKLLKEALKEAQKEAPKDPLPQSPEGRGTREGDEHTR
jgi:hypothetical protein